MRYERVGNGGVFWHILMGHEFLKKISDGPQNLFFLFFKLFFNNLIWKLKSDSSLEYMQYKSKVRTGYR